MRELGESSVDFKQVSNKVPFAEQVAFPFR